jgi:Raf kinase inhibitor-like YbhB/YbcL family protein
MSMIVKVNGIEAGKPIAERFAYCAPDGKGTARPGGNISPAIEWQNVPADTQSFFLMVVDRDVPADFGPANKAGQVIPENAPRQNFYHWLVADIPPIIARVGGNEDVAGQKGRNSYGDGAKGKNGYDGPCPPWNDERVHTYHFIVYALDVVSLGLNDGFSGAEAEKALAGHILAQGEATGIYTTNGGIKLSA